MPGRRATALALALACAGAAGCGGGGDGEAAEAPARPVATAAPSSDVPPEATAQPLRFEAGAKARLAAGETGVVDLGKRAGIAPHRLDVNREQTLTGVRWSGWGEVRATGRGRVETLVCEPTCATGRIDRSSAVIVLSSPRRCRGGRFYTRSTMTYEERATGRTRAPDTYLRTPPC